MTTILLVEDDKNQRLLYEQELRFEGYEIITAIDRDNIDVEAFVQLSMQNMVLPVEVNK